MSYERVPQVGSGADLAVDIDQWIGSPPIRDLVTGSGGDPDAVLTGDLPCKLGALSDFTERWDSRKGAERNQAEPLELDPDTEKLVVDAAVALGLRGGTSPALDRYDHVLMLGGLVRACVTRPAYVARMMREGTLTAGAVTALGGHRPFAGDEFDLARVVGLGDVADEFSALDAGTRRAFELDPGFVTEQGSPEVGNAAWTIRTYGVGDHRTPVTVAAAPSSDPANRRAHTADTYQWFATTLAHLRPGDTVLCVTTQIYVPAQHASALRMLGLPYGVHVETVGMVPGDEIPGLTQTFTPSNYLQEIRSTVRNLRDLTNALPRTA